MVFPSPNKCEFKLYIKNNIGVEFDMEINCDKEFLLVPYTNFLRPNLDR